MTTRGLDATSAAAIMRRSSRMPPGCLHRARHAPPTARHLGVSCSVQTPFSATPPTDGPEPST